MNIKNDGEFTTEELIKYSKKAILKQTSNFSVIGILILLIGFVLSILSFTSDLELSFLPWFLLACGILIIILPYLITLFVPKMLQRQNKATYNGFEYYYEFNDDNFNAIIKSKDSMTNNTLSYNILYKVNVYADAVFIYLNSNVVYMLKKSGFKNEEDMKNVMEFLLKPKHKKENK